MKDDREFHARSASTRMMRSPISTWSPTLATRSRTKPACGAVERMLHLHRFDHREALAGLDLFALPDRERDEAAVHRRADGGVALFLLALGRGERIDQRHERLPPAGEGVSAAIRPRRA